MPQRLRPRPRRGEGFTLVRHVRYVRSWWQRVTRRLTLRSRVTLLATSMVAGALIVASVGLLTGLRLAMVRGLDGTAEHRVDDVSSLINEGKLSSLIPSNDGDSDVTVVLDTSGKVVASSYVGPRDSLVLPFPLPSRLRAGKPVTLKDLRIGDRGDFRVLTGTARVAGEPVTIVVAVSLAQTERSLSVL